MTIAATLSGIQKKIKAPKGQFNSFSNFHYRNCEDILEALKPLLPDGVLVLLKDEIQVIGDRIYVKATAEITDGKESIAASAFAREPQSKKGMDESQITGAASSYARKYALNGMFLIDDTKDSDAGERQPSETDWTWINAVKGDSTILEQLTDPNYKQFIKQHAGIK